VAAISEKEFLDGDFSKATLSMLCSTEKIEIKLTCKFVIFYYMKNKKKLMRSICFHYRNSFLMLLM